MSDRHTHHPREHTMHTVHHQAPITKTRAARTVGHHVGTETARRGMLPMDFATVWTQMAYARLDPFSSVGAAHRFLQDDNSAATRRKVLESAQAAYDAAMVDAS